METRKKKSYQAAPQCRKVVLVFNPETRDFIPVPRDQDNPGSVVTVKVEKW